MVNAQMIFGRLLNPNQQGRATVSGGANANCGALSSSTPVHGQPVSNAAVEITNIWSGPIIILSSDRQAELEKHYLNYNSTIPPESFDAIFRDRGQFEK